MPTYTDSDWDYQNQTVAAFATPSSNSEWGYAPAIVGAFSGNTANSNWAPRSLAVLGPQHPAYVLINGVSRSIPFRTMLNGAIGGATAPVVAAQPLNATFASSADLNLFAYRTGTFAVTGGAAVATMTTAGSNTLEAKPMNLLGGELIGNVEYVQSGPAGIGAQLGVAFGPDFKVWIEYDGYSISAKVKRFTTVTSHYLGQYFNATMAWQKIVIGTDRSISFQLSGNGTTWTTPAYAAGHFGFVDPPWSAKCLEPYFTVSSWQTISSTTIKLNSLLVSSPNLADRSHIDLAPAVLVVDEQFTNNAKPAIMTVDNSSWAASNNVTFANGEMRMAVANGYGSRVYFFINDGLKVRRWGRYEWRMKISNPSGWGPAVMLWPAANRGSTFLNWADGEIDIYEGGNNEFNTTVHWSPDHDMSVSHLQRRESLDVDMTVYRKVELEWTPTTIRTWVDGRMVFFAFDPNSIEYGPIMQTDFAMHIHIGPSDGGHVAGTGTANGVMTFDHIKVYGIPGVSLYQSGFVGP